MAEFYEVRFTVRLPVAATREEAERWLRFHMRDGCDLPLSNPLSDYEPEPVRGTFRTLPTAGTCGVTEVGQQTFPAHPPMDPTP